MATLVCSVWRLSIWSGWLTAIHPVIFEVTRCYVTASLHFHPRSNRSRLKLVAQRMISMQALYLEYCYRLRLVIPEADWELLMQYAKQIKQSDLLEEGVFDPMSPEYRVNGRMALVIALLLRLAHPESLLSSSFELVRKICRRLVLKVKFRLEEGESASKPSSWPSVVTSAMAVRLDTRALLEEVKKIGSELSSNTFSPTLGLDTRFSAAPTSQTIQDLLIAWGVPARTATAWRAPLTENIRVVAGYHAMAGAMSKPAAILGNQETRSRSPYEYRQYSTEYAAEMNKEDPSLQRLRLLMEVAESWQTKGENATGLKCVRLARHPRLQLEQLCFIDPAVFNLKYWMVPPYRDDGNHRHEKTDTGSPV
jgi:hypothetical protein